MGIKKSLMLSDKSVEFMRQRSRGEEISWSQAVNAAFDDLAFFMNENNPKNLTTEEWRMLLNAFASSEIEWNPGLSLAGAVADDLGIEDLDAINASTSKSIKKLMQLSKSEQRAAFDLVKRYWNADWNSLLTTHKLSSLGEQIEFLKKNNSLKDRQVRLPPESH
jgi:hypothetical protein